MCKGRMRSVKCEVRNSKYEEVVIVGGVEEIVMVLALVPMCVCYSQLSPLHTF